MRKEYFKRDKRMKKLTPFSIEDFDSENVFFTVI